MSFSLIGFIVAFLICYLLVPIVRRLGFKIKIVDLPNYRKIHKDPTPCTGGIAIYTAFFVTIGIFLFFIPLMDLFEIKKLGGLFIASTLLFLLGIYDDKRQIKSIHKFIGQLVIILIAFSFNLKINSFSFSPLGIDFIQLGWIAFPITLFWFLGFINAINLIDGLDGLAGGIVFIISFTLFIIAVSVGDITLGILSASLAGVTLAFLRFNFVEEKIFLGDNGSMFLGFLIATLPIIGAVPYKSATMGVFLITLVCSGVPIYDTASVIILRLKSKKSIFEADQNHIHHRLLAKGLSPNQVVISLYTTTLLLATGTVVFTISKHLLIGIIILLVGVGVFTLVKIRALNKLRRLVKVIKREGIL